MPRTWLLSLTTTRWRRPSEVKTRCARSAGVSGLHCHHRVRGLASYRCAFVPEQSSSPKPFHQYMRDEPCAWYQVPAMSRDGVSQQDRETRAAMRAQGQARTVRWWARGP